MIDEHMAPSGNPGGALGRVLDRLQNVSQEGRGWKASCPLPGHGKGRGDLKPSLSVGEGDDGRVLLNCHVGCAKGDVLGAIGLSMSDLFEKPASNGHRSPSKKRRGKIVETYDYTDESGKLLFQSLRYEQPKDFRQRKPDGAGEWKYQGVFENGTRPVLYRFPKVLAAVRKGRPVWVVEGEKDVHRMEEEGFTATTNPMGAEKWPDHLSEPLVGADVRISGDNDEAGRAHVLKVARALHGKAASVKIVELPGVPEGGGDVSDWFAAGGTVEELEELAAQAFEWAPPEPETRSGGKTGGPRPEPEFRLTDTGNAERLVARHGKDLRYVHAWNRWLVWTGKNWQTDDTGEIHRRAKDTVRSIYGEAQEASDSSTRRELASHATKCEAESRLRAMIALAQSEEGVPVRVEDLDTDTWLLTVQNGTIDLKTGELREHRREDSITKISPVMYDPDAKAPTWDAFLARILPSEAIRRFVQRLVGYSLTGDVSAQILPFLYGFGANGKSTLVNIVLTVLGDYGQQAAPELLLSKRGAHPTELADLKGARLVTSVEIEDGRQLAEALVKQLTGGEKIKARYLHKDFFEFDPTHKVFLVANHKPEVQGTDHAIWRRVKLIPFEVTIPEEEQDPHLPEKLQAELSGILAWAVRGCLDWQREGLAEPEEVKEATEAYRAEMDVLADFIRERCVVRDGVWCIFADLYESYEKWCEESGETAEKKRKFGTRLKERGFSPDNGTRNVAIRRGIALRHDREPEDAPTATGDEGVNEENRNVNSQKTCKTRGNSESVNESYPENEKYSSNPSTRVVSENTLTLVNSLTPEQEQESEKVVPPRPSMPLEKFFSNPPDWFATQLDKCREEERLVRPTCATIAEKVFGTVTRWAEVEPVLRRHLAEVRRTS